MFIKANLNMDKIQDATTSKLLNFNKDSVLNGSTVNDPMSALQLSLRNNGCGWAKIRNNTSV